MPPSPTLLLTRPTIEVGGQAQPALAANLLRMSVVENTTGLHRCELTFKNWGTIGRGRNATAGFLYFDRSQLDFGKRVVIKLPSGTIMDGAITALSANYPAGATPEITVVVEDSYRDLRLVSRTRTFESAADSDIARQIANDHGLEASVNFSGPTYKSVAQLNQSDLAFLRGRARLCDAELRLQGQQLSLKSRANSGSEVVSLALGNNLISFSVLADTATQPTRVAATAWDVASKSADTITVTDSILGSQLRGGTGGARTVLQAFGERPVSLPLSPLDPHIHAESAFRTEAQRFVAGHGATQADAHLAVGVMVRLANLGPLFSGLYYVSEVTHAFDLQAGATTKFTAESPALGQTQ